MTTGRIALACSAVTPGPCTLQSDCIRAYIQALTDSLDGVNTYVELHRAWQPTRRLTMRRPVVKLQALYNHPRAGDLWHAKLDKVLIKMSFSKHEAWLSVCVLKTVECGTDVCIILAYVDDLLMTGTPTIKSTIKKLKEQVVMDDPMPTGKYLGVVHKVATYDLNSEIVTEVIFDMRVFIKSAIDNYVKRTG